MLPPTGSSGSATLAPVAPNNITMNSNNTAAATTQPQQQPPVSTIGHSSMNNNNTTTPVSSNGGGGLRGAVKGLFKAATVLSLRDSSSHHNNNSHHNNSRRASSSTNNSNNYLPEPVSHERLLEKHAAALQQQSLTEADVALVLADADQFHAIQAALRNGQSQTNALARQIGGALLRERLVQLRLHQAAAAAEQKREQRQHAMARELTEARIKARQALNMEPGVSSDEDEDGAPSLLLDKSVVAAATSSSPTSITAFVTMDDPQVMGTFKPGLLQCDEEDSQDGDIQEVDESS